MTHHRISDEGKKLGRVSVELVNRGRKLLAASGLTDLKLPTVRDGMCTSCACRSGSVPNGCLQTQIDFLKAVVQAVPFLCHAPKDGRMCAGFIAARAGHVASPLPDDVVAELEAMPFSPPDDESQENADG